MHFYVHMWYTNPSQKMAVIGMGCFKINENMLDFLKIKKKVFWGYL